VNYWLQREKTPVLTLYPVPNTALTLTYYALRQVEDASLTDGQNADIPYRYLEAFAHGLAWRVAAIWNPTRRKKLKALADESYNIAVRGRRRERQPLPDAHDGRLLRQ
jgi:hypothetical protein